MALIPPKYLQAVVALGLRAAPEEAEETAQAMRELGTGFLYAYLSSEGQADSGFRLWLVTCKHVIEQAIKATNGDEILVRLNRSEHRGMQTFKISLRQGEGPDWTAHPTADVAVIATSWQDLETKGVQWETFAAGRNTLRREKAAEVGLSEGDETFVLGFPIGWRPGRQDYPIVRHGMLAQVQGWLRSEHDTYLVDGSGFPRKQRWTCGNEAAVWSPRGHAKCTRGFADRNGKQERALRFTGRGWRLSGDRESDTGRRNGGSDRSHTHGLD